MSGSKNIGQVSGLFIGTTTPENTALIWYDTSTNQRCHKVYDFVTKSWVSLNPQIVSNTTYSELVNNASKNGLTVGKFYKMTDKSNTLAIAISSTRIQYVDTLGTLIIDDLGSNQTYTVTNNNLLFDGLGGVFDGTTKKLMFSFSEATPNQDDYIYARKKSSATNNVLFKFAIGDLISKAVGNVITWHNGLFVNMSNILNNLVNKAGGILGYDKYTTDKAEIENSIDTIGKSYQSLVTNVNNALEESLADTAIFEKKLAQNPTVGTASDIKAGDSLKTIITKIQRWITQYKYAKGIKISGNFTSATTKQYINNNDTVESALQKIQFYLRNAALQQSLVLPENWNTKSTSGENDAYVDDGAPVANDEIIYAIAKLTAFIEHSAEYGKFTTEWGTYTKEPAPIAAYPTDEDSVEVAIKKLLIKLRQLGTIVKGGVNFTAVSQEEGESEYVNKVNIMDEVLRLGLFSVNDTTHGRGLPNRVNFGPSHYIDMETGLFHLGNNNGGITFDSSDILEMSTANKDGIKCKGKSNASDAVDASISRLAVKNMVYDYKFISEDTLDYSINGDNQQTFLVILRPASQSQKAPAGEVDNSVRIYLPSSPKPGTVVKALILGIGYRTIYFLAQGNDTITYTYDQYVDTDLRLLTCASNTTQRAIGKASGSDAELFTFMYIPGFKYSGENTEGNTYASNAVVDGNTKHWKMFRTIMSNYTYLGMGSI